MSMLSFKPTNDRQFELHIGTLPTGFLWPSQRLLDFYDADVKTQYGLDLEAEELSLLACQFADAWTPYQQNLPMTRLELVVAYSTARKAVAAAPPKGKSLSSRS